MAERVSATRGLQVSRSPAPRVWVPAFAGTTTAMTYPGEKFYPPGVKWDDAISRGTLPELLSTAAESFGARTAIEFRDRPISYSELEDKVETAAAAFLRAGFGKNSSVALFLG